MVTVRKLALLGIFVVVFVVGGAVLIGTVLWTRITEPYKGYAPSEQFVEIQPGSTAGDIRRGLVSGGIIRDDFTARAALFWTRQASRLKAGHSSFGRPTDGV